MALQQKPNISKHDYKLVNKPIYERYEEVMKKKNQDLKAIWNATWKEHRQAEGESNEFALYHEQSWGSTSY